MLKPEAALRKDQRGARERDVMQHRHYAIIAGIIDRRFRGRIREDLARIFADELASTNANFNRARFIAACLAT